MVQYASWLGNRAVGIALARQEPRAATACSRHIALAEPAAPGRLAAAARRIGARQIARTAGPIDQPSPAMWCSSSSSTCSLGSSANRCARSGGSVARSKPRRAAAARASASAASVTDSTASRGRAAEASRISCRGTPSVSGKTVRRLSWRSTTSPSAASSAAWSSAPVRRRAIGIV